MSDGRITAGARRAQSAGQERPSSEAADDYIRIAGSALLAAPVRTCLTMLGIIIGVASMVSMAAIGAGAQTKVHEQIRSFGANVIMINANASNRGRPETGSTVRIVCRSTTSPQSPNSKRSDRWPLRSAGWRGWSAAA